MIINNRYCVISELGVGGFAIVYKAWDNMLQKFVAIKKIHEEYSKDAQFVDLFRTEAVNTAKLEHENIVRVINFIKDDDGSFYMVMDLVNGVDMEYLIEKCRKSVVKLPVHLILYIISEVVKALDYAHTVKDEITGLPLNIVHRDISPGNIMLYFDGRIKLADFGIAKAGDKMIKDSKKGKLKGKIAYMSPEQARGEINIDGRSDLFSCGLVAIEAITLEKVFLGDTEFDIWQKVKNAEVNFQKLKEQNISEEMLFLLMKILQKSADNRYKNAAEMFLGIKRILIKKGKAEEIKSEYVKFISILLDDEIKKAKAQSAFAF